MRAGEAAAPSLARSLAGGPGRRAGRCWLLSNDFFSNWRRTAALMDGAALGALAAPAPRSIWLANTAGPSSPALCGPRCCRGPQSPSPSPCAASVSLPASRLPPERPHLPPTISEHTIPLPLPGPQSPRSLSRHSSALLQSSPPCPPPSWTLHPLLPSHMSASFAVRED